MNEEHEETANVIDITIKALFRSQPLAALRLAGIQSRIEPVSFEDTSISLPEMRADHVFLIGEKDAPGYGAIYVEYQLQPSAKAMKDWFTKRGGLMKQLNLPVVLLVIYIKKGDRATFPDRLVTEVAGLQDVYVFPVVLLWEHRERIANGEFPELAPIMIVFDPEPNETTLKREIEIIHQAGFTKEVKADLLGMALRLAEGSFSKDLLRAIFREELDMVQHGGIIEEWITEAEARGVQESTIRVLTLRLGELPDALIERINKSDKDWCYRLMERTFSVESLDELTIED